MSVVNIRKKELNKRNINNFEEWESREKNVYIGRNVRYVKGIKKSKWSNPYNIKIHGVEKCLKLYEEYIRNSKLYNEIKELEGKELGCWCKPEKCHGDILVKLLNELK